MDIEQNLRLSWKNANRLLEFCARRGSVAVVMQDNPDPDALACAAAVRDLVHQRLGKRAAIGYGGVCGRAENRAMVRELGIDARKMTPAELRGYRTVCLVDAQPQSGNNTLLGKRRPEFVIDHHLLPRNTAVNAEFADVRPEYGAASTILYEYLCGAKTTISASLATALFYGIQSDTQDLGREASPAGIRAYQELMPMIDRKKLTRIRRAPVPPEYFRMLARSLADCVVAGHTVISCIHDCHNADMIAEVADLLMRLEGARYAVCFGCYEDTILLSARGVDTRGNVADHMKRVVAGLGTGGGHRMMAGGRIPLNGDGKQRLAQVRARILRVFAGRQAPERLID